MAKYTGAFPTKTIKKGSKGTNVTRWQNFLKWMGYSLKADSVFGSTTKEKTIACQKKLGFEGKDLDGIVGPKTIAKAKAYKKAEPQKAKKCIDISYWQGKISETNWRKVLQSCEYAICRASYTNQNSFTLNKDSTFPTNFVNAKAAGLKVGAYHYSQAITVDEAKREAEYLCSILKDYSPTFYVVCDFEFGKRLNSKIGKKASDIANAFCDVVKEHGYDPCIYANTSTLNNYLTNPKYPVWVAQYADSCTYKGSKVMWQYTSSGCVDGISGRVDLSYVYAEPAAKQTTAEGYTGVLPGLRVTKTADEVIADALKWGKWIADNNIYHYGEYGNKAYITPSSKYYEDGKYKKIHDVTHSCGCHFCGTNKARKNDKAAKLGYKGENWEHTYVCNTFVTAIFAHGGMESVCLGRCRKGGAAGFSGEGKVSVFDKSKNWTYLGKIPIKDLKAGDVLVSATHMQCVYAPVSSSKVKIIEATSYVGKYGSAASNKSIRVIEKKPSYLSVYRFTGNVDSDIAIRYGEYSARVLLLQKFLNWSGFNCGTEDGKFGDKTRDAVKSFQKKRGLTEDGIVGANTLAKMKTETK